MRAAAATILLMSALAIALVATSTQRTQKNAPAIYEQGILLIKETPDLPAEAAALLSRMPVAHSRDELEAMLGPDTRVIVYDCSAWTEVRDGYLSFRLAEYIGIVGINVSRGNLLDPRGCEQSETVPPFFSMMHQGRSESVSCGGSSTSAFEHDGFGGRAFRLFLERELMRDGTC